MKLAQALTSLLVLCVARPVAPNEAGEYQSYLSALSGQGVDQAQILGPDSGGVPMVCGTGLQAVPWSEPSDLDTAAALPLSTRGWESIPAIIRNDGIDAFRLEVTVTAPVAGITLDGISHLILPPTPPPIILVDNGSGEDQIAGDGVYTAGPFRFNNSVSLPSNYLGDPSSPSGLYDTNIGTIEITETNNSTTAFLIDPEVGILRSDILPVAVLHSAQDITVTSHLINISSNSGQSQLALRYLGGDLTELTERIYEILPDSFDFIVAISTDKIEHTPRTTSANFHAGIHQTVQVNYSGTGQSSFDNSAVYGSAGRLLGVSVLDVLSRGLVSNNAVHEILHQWSAYISTSLGISDGTGHYIPRTSVGSMVGGFRWVDQGGGAFTLDCEEGRNGGTLAAPLDRYMMGVIESGALEPIYRNDTINFGTDCGSTVTAADQTNLSEIILAHGVRSPGPATARRAFSIAFVVESKGRLLNATELTYFNELARHFTAAIPAGDPSPRLGFNWPSMRNYFGSNIQWTTAIDEIFVSGFE